jgi:ribonuclease P protein component
VFAHKRSVAGKFFQVYAKLNGLKNARLGITVSKRFVPHATARNYCKRLARETFRGHRDTLSGVDLVVRARAVVLRSASDQAREEILDLMQRARLLCYDGADATNNH